MWRVKQAVRNVIGYKVDPQDLEAYRSVIPSSIRVNIQKDSDHELYIAHVRKINGKDLQNTYLVTEARSQDELVEMVNDLILSYKDVPESLRPYFKRILKPEDVKISSTNRDLKLVKA